jgi:hypothetical protein
MVHQFHAESFHQTNAARLGLLGSARFVQQSTQDNKKMTSRKRELHSDERRQSSNQKPPYWGLSSASPFRPTHDRSFVTKAAHVHRVLGKCR